MAVKYVAVEGVIWLFRWLCYVLPIGYSLATLMREAMVVSPDYAGAISCVCEMQVVPGTSGVVAPLCLTDPTDANSLHPCNPKGFYCPTAPPQSCFGTSGLDITDSVGVTYDSFSSEVSEYS